MQPGETISLSPVGAANLPNEDRNKRKYNFMMNVLERLAGTGLDERNDRNPVIDFVRGSTVEDPTLFQHVLAGHLSGTPKDGRWRYPGYKEFKSRLKQIEDYRTSDPRHRGSPVETNRLKRQLAASEPGRRDFTESLRRRLQTMFSEASRNMSSGTSTETITITKEREGDHRKYKVVIPKGIFGRGSPSGMIVNLEKFRRGDIPKVFSFQPDT